MDLSLREEEKFAAATVDQIRCVSFGKNFFFPPVACFSRYHFHFLNTILCAYSLYDEKWNKSNTNQRTIINKKY